MPAWQALVPALVPREELPSAIALNSAQFAEFLRKARDEDRDLAFLIGGAFGLASDVSSSSTMRLSLAPWTLPHEIARLVLAEQIYRAGTIVRGEPYHK